MKLSEILDRSNTFLYAEDKGDTELLDRLSQENELLRIVPGIYYRGTKTSSGYTPPPQDDALNACLPSGWGYTGFTALSRLGLNIAESSTIQVAVPRACQAPASVSVNIKQHRYGRAFLTPMEVTVLETLETSPAEPSQSLLEACQNALRSSKPSQIISCTVNEPQAVRRHLIDLLSLTRTR